MPDSTKSKIQLIDSIKKLNQKIQYLKDHKVNFKTSYLTYEFSGKHDSLDLKTPNVDLLIITNNTSKDLILSIYKPWELPIHDIIFTSADPSTSLSGPHGQIAEGQLLIISVLKLKEINQNLTLRVDVPSIKEQPPFQLLTLKIK